MKLNIREIAVFGMLGALMFASKIVMEAFPNIHLLGVLTMVITLVYRQKALYPIYIYVLINGAYAGFSVWWIPYLYIWTVLWGVTMLLPKQMPETLRPVVYMAVCALHGLLFGTLYAPVQAILFGYDLRTTVAWIIAGLPWDCIHAAGNLVLGTLIVPLTAVLRRLKPLTD